MRSLVFLFIFSLCCFGFSQNLNGYKYVSMPDQFTGFSKPNQYRLVTYARTLFKRNGFEILKTSETNQWPEDAISNPCLVLSFTAEKQKSVFKNKLNTYVTNCKGEKAFEAVGISSIKEFEKGYQDAIQLAIEKYPIKNYKFDEGLVIHLKSNENKKIAPPKMAPIPDLNSSPHLIYTFKDFKIIPETISDKKLLFVDYENQNHIIIKGTTSSVHGIYHVKFTNKKGETKRGIAYFSNLNLIIDLPTTTNKGTTEKIEFIRKKP